MIDVKWQNGEPDLDSVYVLGDPEARFQRALIAVTANKGAFIYNRALGADYQATVGAEELKRKTEQIFNEALASYDDTAVTVVSAGSNTIVDIHVNGETRREAVVQYGYI